MLGTIKRITIILGIIEWLLFIAFFGIMGWHIYPKSNTVAIGLYIVCLLLLLALIIPSSKIDCETRNYVMRTKPMGNPFLDLMMLAICLQAYIQEHEWFLLGLTGTVCLTIDLIRWALFLWLKHKKVN